MRGRNHRVETPASATAPVATTGERRQIATTPYAPLATASAMPVCAGSGSSMEAWTSSIVPAASGAIHREREGTVVLGRCATRVDTAMKSALRAAATLRRWVGSRLTASSIGRAAAVAAPVGRSVSLRDCSTTPAATMPSATATVTVISGKPMSWRAAVTQSRTATAGTTRAA